MKIVGVRLSSYQLSSLKATQVQYHFISDKQFDSGKINVMISRIHGSTIQKHNRGISVRSEYGDSILK